MFIELNVTTTSKSTLDFLLDQLSNAEHVTVKKMFSGYCLYLAGKPIGLINDNQLFLKPTNAGRTMIPDINEALPYVGAKPYFLISADMWEDREWLSKLIQITANELPQFIPRSKKKHT